MQVHPIPTLSSTFLIFIMVNEEFIISPYSQNLNNNCCLAISENWSSSSLSSACISLEEAELFFFV